MKKPIIAVLGGKGMLGTDVTRVLGDKDFEVLPYDLPDFDITRSHDLEKVMNSAEVIINCAAYTNVDGAESEKEKAHAINALAVKDIGQRACELRRYVIHISTDFVYDGAHSGYYTEKDATNPINYYGKSKLEGEHFLQESGCRHAIVRLQWTYGEAGANFITKISQKAKQSDSFSVVNDQIGSPTPTLEAAMMLCEFLKNQIEGLFLFAAQGYASRYEIAQFIVEKLNLSAKVTPCQTSEFITPAQRPLNSKFDCSKIDSVLNRKRTDWKMSLNKFLEKIK